LFKYPVSSNSNCITDFDFSSNNQYIASCSMDKTVRVWEISKGTCIRVVYGVSSQLCISFHPVSTNLLEKHGCYFLHQCLLSAVMIK
jgi:WD40 repeat protein